jgi:hypothetical protein
VHARAKLGVIDTPLPAGIHVIDAVQHDYLFPLCSGVVHHGEVHMPCCLSPIFESTLSLLACATGV